MMALLPALFSAGLLCPAPHGRILAWNVEDDLAVPVRQWRSLTYDKLSSHLAFDGSLLWIGTVGGGVIRWDTATGTYVKSTRVDHGLASDFVNDMTLEHGLPWVATDRGLSHWNGVRWTTFDGSNSPLSSLVTAVDVDAAGVKWIGTYDAGLFLYDGKGWKNLSTANSGLSDDFVTSIELDASGAAWIGVWGDGVDRYDGSTWTNYDPSNSALTSYFVHVKAAHPTSGEVWFWCNDDSFFPQVGTVRYDGSSWQSFLTSNSGIHSDYIHSITIDQEDQVWFQGSDAISRWDRTSWTLFPDVPSFFDYNFPKGKSLAVRDDGELWAGTAFGFARFDGQDFVGMATPELWDGHVDGVAVTPDGTLWMSTRAGLSGLSPAFRGGWLRYSAATSPLPDDDVDSLAVTPSGGLLIGTRGGAALLQSGGWTVWTTANSGIHANQILEVGVGGDGAAWFGSAFFGGGASRLEDGTWTRFTTANGLVHNSVYAIAGTPGGPTWIGTAGGLSRLQNGQWTSWTTAQGLPHNLVNDLAVAPDGAVWMATHGGVARLANGVVTAYTTANGLPGNQANGILVEPSGIVWVGLHDFGAARFDGTTWTSFRFEDGLVNDRVLDVARGADGTLWFGTGYGVGGRRPGGS